ncbi:hypothetical protein ACN3E9_01315 [Vibrio pectenicida]|uniref:hypothetical protein n=1 Tax=Vibrio pectenicida TaxID=62763 RepID=UPI003B9CE0D4
MKKLPSLFAFCAGFLPIHQALSWDSEPHSNIAQNTDIQHPLQEGQSELLDKGVKNIHQLPKDLKLDIHQAGDRGRIFDKFEMKHNRVKMMSADGLPSDKLSNDDKRKITDSTLFNLNKFKTDEAQSGGFSAPFIDNNTYKILERYPIETPDINLEHTINVDNYLSNRIPSGIIDEIRHSGAEFFLSNKSVQYTSQFYEKQGFDKMLRVQSPSSTKFYLAMNTEKGTSKVVISGINSEARLKHQMLQLHYSGIDLDMLSAVGDMGETKESAMTHLNAELLKLDAADDKILYIGSRWMVMEYLGNFVGELNGNYEGDENNEGDGYNYLNPKTHNAGGFLFDTAKIELADKTILVAALRMPNGDLSYDATSTFMKNGFNRVVMVGAGGSITPSTIVGNYMPIESSSYNDMTVDLDSFNWSVPQLPFISSSTTLNVTVDSPLVETKLWLEQQKNTGVGNVDVETFHILKAAKENDCSIVPGMFISDVVGIHPLEEKISGGGADKNLSSFVRATMSEFLL